MASRPRPIWYVDPYLIDVVEHQLTPIDTRNVHHSFAHQHHRASFPHGKYLLQAKQKRLNRALAAIPRRRRTVILDDREHYGAAKNAIY